MQSSSSNRALTKSSQDHVRLPSGEIAYVRATLSKFRKAAQLTAGCPYISLELPGAAYCFRTDKFPRSDAPFGSERRFSASRPVSCRRIPAPRSCAMAGFGFTGFRCRSVASRVSSPWSSASPVPKPRPPLRGFIQSRGMIWARPVRAWSLFPAVVFRGGSRLQFTNLAPVPNHRAGKGLLPALVEPQVPCRCVACRQRDVPFSSLAMPSTKVGTHDRTSPQYPVVAVRSTSL